MPENAAGPEGEDERGLIEQVAEGVCDLCGLPLSRQCITEKTLRFCCPGCRQVFKILSGTAGIPAVDFRSSEIFRACIEAGVIPEVKVPAAVPAAPNASDQDIAVFNRNLHVEGMWCPACAWLIEEVLKKTEGIERAHVSFFSDMAKIEYLPHRTSPAEIMAAIEKLGYKAYEGNVNPFGRNSKDNSLVRLGVASVLTINVMMLAYALYAGFIRSLTPTVIAYFSYPMFVMTVPIVFYAGMPIIRKALTGLRHAVISMDTLVSIAVLSAFAYSSVRMMQGSIHTYFDTTAMLVTIVLLGRYVEAQAHERVVAGIAFDETTLTKVHLRGESSEQWLNASAVIPGDRFIVEKGEYVPLDGFVAAGECVLDQSAITGETCPIVRRMGDQVLAGSLDISGEIEVTATKNYSESLVHQMGDLVLKSLEYKSAEETLSDRISRIFLPAVLSIAVTTALVLWLSGYALDAVLLRGLTVLLISCPCTLGIAIPLVKTVSIGLGRKMGVLIATPEALSRMKKLDTMVFDKTGTITEGNLTLRRVLHDTMGEKEALQFLAGIEGQSKHFLAREIRRQAHNLGMTAAKPEVSEELESMGVTGILHGKRTFAGNRRLLEHLRVGLPTAVHLKALQEEAQGMTVVFFGCDDEANGIASFGDAVKDGAHDLMDWLEKRGIKVVLVSGDTEKTTKTLAASIGVDDAFGGMLPDDKVRIIATLQSEGHTVGMVGDGINDAGAIAQADIGFALAPAYEVTRQAADFIIPSGKPYLLKNIFTLASSSERKTHQNMFFSFVYNAIAIPVAVAGLLNPLIAVFAMFASSLTVILNTLCLRPMKAVNNDELSYRTRLL
ncbi:MAG TPA: cation-translocating P-type ATPase [Syntrophorhabdaceae bacterium]|nr:cation-translocating P-type ATPase [Syntrophorhabdaceae bacterium]